MLSIHIISVGKKHDALLAQSISHYEGRLKHSCKLSWSIIPSSDVQSESSAILEKTNLDDVVVLLDETGKAVDNNMLAKIIDDAQNQAVRRLVFVIGGAYGVNDDVKNRADYILSISGLIFPHQLVRLILLEQLYRSYSILSGGKYHHS